MAICRRCGRQTESGGDGCPSCSEYATSISSAGTYTSLAARARHSWAGESVGLPVRYPAARSVGHKLAESEFASLPHFERPFAAIGTVWPDGPDLVPAPGDVGTPDLDAGPPARRDPEQPDLDARDPDAHDQEQRELELGDLEQSDLEQSDLEQSDLEQSEPEQDDPEPEDPEQGDLAPGHLAPGGLAQPDSAQPHPERAALPGPATLADTGDQAPRPDELAVLPRSGRWIALSAAIAVLLVAAAGAVTVVVRHDQANRSARINRPAAAASPTSSAPVSVAPAGPDQLIVDQAAATAPDEAAIAATLKRYFGAINNHEYLIYKRTFIMALRGAISPGAFLAGFGTTTDSAEQLRSITVTGAGQADALVTFVSQQSSPGSPTCTAWSMEFYLGQRAGRYLQIAPPQLYKESDVSCS